MTIIRSKLRLLLRLINRIPLHDKDFPCLKMRLISSLFLMISVLVRLLLIASCEAMSALSSAASEYKTTTFCSHSCTETELSCSLHLARMIGSLSFVTHLIYSKFIALKRLISDYGCLYARLWDSNKHSITGQPIRLYHSDYLQVISFSRRKFFIEIIDDSSFFQLYPRSGS